MRFSPRKFQLPWVMSDKISRVGYITISSVEPQRIDIPTISILLNMPTIPTHPWIILLMAKSTLVSLIAWNCRNIQSTPSLYPSRKFPQLFICKEVACHDMETVYFLITTDITSHQNYIIIPCLNFSPIQLKKSILFVRFWWVAYSVWSLGSTPTVNLELFRTDLLKYPYEFSCWYIVVVKGKGTEAIISSRMTNFTIALLYRCTISPFPHCTIAPFHSFRVLPFHHYKHTIIFVT